jgi:parvulin-like peptidyl-prolyl isomerase
VNSQRLLALLVAALAILATACGDLAKPYAAKVNGSRVSQASLDRELKVILDNKQVLQALESGLQAGETIQGKGKGTVSTSFAARLLTRRILLELIHQEISRRKLKPSAAVLTKARQDAVQQFGDEKLFRSFPKGYQAEVVQGNVDVALLREKVVGDVTDAEIQQFYDDNSASFHGRCISHILVDSKEKADQLRAQIAAGADFADVAMEASTDTGSGQQGGALGCFQPGEPLQFVEPFKTAAETLPVGELSQPIQTQFGWHLIKVTDSESLAQVKDQIRSQLEQQGGQAKFNEVLLSLVKKARIEVNPRFGRFSKNQADLGVVPPEAPQLAPTSTTTPALQAPPGG